ncbi:hypothetical protein, partial [Enterobacter sp.]|uniref:hypothetical protein n=1 Tax=Enterobacter sp. TaxID=42895 RepID=UPI00290000E1
GEIFLYLLRVTHANPAHRIPPGSVSYVKQHVLPFRSFLTIIMKRSQQVHFIFEEIALFIMKGHFKYHHFIWLLFFVINSTVS